MHAWLPVDSELLSTILRLEHYGGLLLLHVLQVGLMVVRISVLLHWRLLLRALQKLLLLHEFLLLADNLEYLGQLVARALLDQRGPMLVIDGLHEFVDSGLEFKGQVSPAARHVLVEEAIDGREDDICEEFGGGRVLLDFGGGLTWSGDLTLGGRLEVQGELRDERGEFVYQEYLALGACSDRRIC